MISFLLLKKDVIALQSEEINATFTCVVNSNWYL